MKLQMVGCSHHTAPVEIREKLAFSPDQIRQALQSLRNRYPETEAVLLSTCNRVELYIASEVATACPSHHDVVSFLAEFHGLTTDEIGRAFLVPESTVAQRIVRAKRTLAEAKVPFEVPRGADFTARLSSVLEVIYLVFNEGYAATAGGDWMRPALCDDALR